MVRTTLVMMACLGALLLGVPAGFAEDVQGGEKPGAAVAPADQAGAMTGCPADGSCCGSPACRQAKAAVGADGAAAEGGCPCMRNKLRQQREQQEPKP